MAGLDPLVGALISGGSALAGIVAGGFVTRSNERRRAGDAREAGLAVLGVEAYDALEIVYGVRDDKKWPIACDRTWTETWLSVRGAILTNPANADVMKDVARAFTSMDELERAVNEPRPIDNRSLSIDDKVFLIEKQELLEPALDALNEPRPNKPERLEGEDVPELLRELRAGRDPEEEAAQLEHSGDSSQG